MNPVFGVLIALAAVGLWFIISPVFTWLGRKVSKKLDKTAEILNKNDNEEKEKVENEQ